MTQDEMKFEAETLELWFLERDIPFPFQVAIFGVMIMRHFTKRRPTKGDVDMIMAVMSRALAVLEMNRRQGEKEESQ